jgi:MFS family permease
MGSYCLGALIGCATNFYVEDYFGRRRMMWIAMAFIIAGATLQTSAYRISHLIVGCIICGIGTGIDSSTVPIYQSELCEKERRGRLVSWEVLFIGVGVGVAVSLINYPDNLICTELCHSTGSTLDSLMQAVLSRGAHQLRSSWFLPSLLSSWSGVCRGALAGWQIVDAKEKQLRWSVLSLIEKLMILSLLSRLKIFERPSLLKDKLEPRRSQVFSRMTVSRLAGE